jgi:hypothetical protein
MLQLILLQIRDHSIGLCLLRDPNFVVSSSRVVRVIRVSSFRSFLPVTDGFVWIWEVPSSVIYIYNYIFNYV